MTNDWQDIKKAPKNQEGDRLCGPWILGVDRFNEQRVMRWTTEYPCSEGVWMYGYGPTDYIDIVLTFEPTHFKPLEDGPHKR